MLSNRLSYLPSPGDLTCSVSGRLNFESRGAVWMYYVHW